MGRRPTRHLIRKALALTRVERPGIAVVMAACLLSVAACDSPTAPDKRGYSEEELFYAMALHPPAYYVFNVVSCKGNSASPNTQCTLGGVWDGGAGIYGERALKDLTNEAEWVSTNAGVVGIGRPGELIAISPGDTEIYATFRGKRSDRIRFRVFGDGDRPRAVAARLTVSVSAGGRLADVLIEVIAGHNAGARGTTSALGSFAFEPWVCGPATIRATKSGYAEVVVSQFTCEGNSLGFNTIVMTPRP